MKFLVSIAAVSVAVGGVPVAAAQTAAATQAATPEVKAGTTVYDGTGAEAATIEAVSGGNATLSTGTNSITVPLTSLGTSPKGPTIAWTKAQINEVAEKAIADAAAKVRAQLIPGAEVRGKTRTTVIGTVKEVVGDTVTLSVDETRTVQLPVSAVASAPEGLYIGMTAEQFDAAVAASSPAPAVEAEATTSE